MALDCIVGNLPELAPRLAKEPGALATLVAAVAAGGAVAAPNLQDAATNSAGVLGVIAGADPELARQVADVPGVLAALAAAVAVGGVAAANRTGTLGFIAEADPALAWCVAEVPGVLAMHAARRGSWWSRGGARPSVNGHDQRKCAELYCRGKPRACTAGGGSARRAGNAPHSYGFG